VFGIYRLTLAFLVVLYHYRAPGFGFSGLVAVFGFYALSGYLITRVVATRYEFSARGLLRFGTNRFLRLFPAYWSVFAVAVLLLTLAPETMSSTNARLVWPASAGDWLQNIFIADLIGERSRLIPPAWSISIEIVFYGLIALGLGRHRSIATLWLALSLAIAIYICVTDDFTRLYFSYTGTSFCFALGSCAYHYADQLQPVRRFMLAALPVFGAIAVLSAQFDAQIRDWLLFAAGLTAAGAVVYLAELTVQSPVLRAFDRLAGEYSYPVFLCHWHALALAKLIIPGPMDTIEKLLAVVIFMALSTLIIRAIDHPVERLRTRIRAA